MLGVAVMPLAITCLLCLAIIWFSARHLAASTSAEANTVLADLYDDFLVTRNEDMAANIAATFRSHLNDLRVIASAAQALVDGSGASVDMAQAFAGLPYFTEAFHYDRKRRFSINAPNPANVSVSVWSYLHDDERIRPETENYLRENALTRYLLGLVSSNREQAGWMYQIGPKVSPTVAITPWAPLGEIFDARYPGHNDVNFWDFFFPGIVEGWEAWLMSPANRNAVDSGDVTITPIYDDAGGTGLMMTLFQPIWSRDRERNEGAIGFDYNITALLETVGREKVGDTGFAFIVTDEGSILSFDEALLRRLSIPRLEQQERGVELFEANLFESSENDFTKIFDPRNDRSFGRALIDGAPFHVTFGKIMSFNEWGETGIRKRTLFLASVVSEEEIFALKTSLLRRIDDTYGHSIVIASSIALLVFMLAVAAAAALALREARQVRHLLHAIDSVKSERYDASVDIVSSDELGDLASAFNQLFGRIRESRTQMMQHAEDLEMKVRERTASLEAANLKLDRISKTDFLTGLSNRRHFNENLAATWDSARRAPGGAISAILFDVDFFKQYNDTYGHLVGDECLKKIANVARGCIRENEDLIARFGGEEFIIVGRACAHQAMTIAERICEELRKLNIPHAASACGFVSISIGVATMRPDAAASPTTLLRLADQALYESKNAGRNTITAKVA